MRNERVREGEKRMRNERVRRIERMGNERVRDG
jgi:hypothetical protein